MGVVLSLLGRVPIWVWLVAGLAIWGWFGHNKAKQYEQARLESIAETERLARSVEAKKAEEATKVEQRYADTKKRLQIDLDRLHTANLSLQQLIASDNHTAEDIAAVCGPYVERNAVSERLLRESNQLATEGAERVVRLAAKVSALQDHINNVCVSK